MISTHDAIFMHVLMNLFFREKVGSQNPELIENRKKKPGGRT